jgi:hypothetical protein
VFDGRVLIFSAARLVEAGEAGPVKNFARAHFLTFRSIEILRSF